MRTLLCLVVFLTEVILHVVIAADVAGGAVQAAAKLVAVAEGHGEHVETLGVNSIDIVNFGRQVLGHIQY